MGWVLTRQRNVRLGWSRHTVTDPLNNNAMALVTAVESFVTKAPVAYTIKILLLSHDNGTPHFKKSKQLFEYQHLLLLRDIWCSKF
jgi:hypothetical protein